MTVLVTGGAGYIGSVTVAALIAEGHKVVVLDDLSTGHREALDPEIPFQLGSIGDPALVEQIIAAHRVTACIHFAARSIVSESQVDPSAYFVTNIADTIQFLAALRRAGVRELVFSSSAAVYGNPVTTPIDEDHPLAPTHPYGFSKLTIERILVEIDRAYGFRHVALRYFNAAGASATHGEDHDPETHLIPNLLRCAMGELAEVSLFGNDYPTPDGTAIRDYVHVSDLARAHILALNHLAAGRPSAQINLGTGEGHSVMQVIDAARAITGHLIPIVRMPRRSGDPPRLVAAARKARELLDWQPRSTLPEIIESAWCWRCQHPRGYRV